MIRHACKAGGWPCGQLRDEARWTANNVGHCSSCGDLFIGAAFERHRSAGQCLDPATMENRKGEPVFEKVVRPLWDPAFAWRLAGAAPTFLRESA